MKPFLAVKNWRKHQHYKKRDSVPWIKLYAALLEDVRFVALSDAAQLQLIKVWLLASRVHPLPNNAAYIAGKIGVRRVRLAELVASGFLYETSNATEGHPEDASANASTDASTFDSTLTRGRERGEKEKRKKIPVVGDADARATASAQRLEGASDASEVIEQVANGMGSKRLQPPPQPARVIPMHARPTWNDR